MQPPVIPMIICLLLSGLTLFAQAGKSHHYPVITPAEKTFHILDVAKANVRFFVHSPNGQPMYELQCHSSSFSGDPDFDYSGDLECRLSSAGHHKDQYSTLLTEDPEQSRDWQSRARFFGSDLRPPCSAIPQFGAIRKFRLRGMDLTLEIVKPKFKSDGSLTSLTLQIIVKPDASSETPIAKLVPIPAAVPEGCPLGQHFPGASKR